MPYNVLVTEAAQSDLMDALDYISTTLANPSAAGNLLIQIEECYVQLGNYPMMYAACQDPRLQAAGYRKAVIGHFVLIYRVHEIDHTVFVLRFFYGGRDYEKLL